MKKAPDEYRRNPHSVTLINYHFVFCPKRRKKVLIGKISHRLQEVIFGLCTENNWRLIALEIMPDHVHLFLNTDPTFAPSVIIKRIKGKASHHLRKEFPELKKLPTLWTPSYFVATFGEAESPLALPMSARSSVRNASTETIKRYIENQTNK